MRFLDSVTFDAGKLVLEGEECDLLQWHTTDGDFVTPNNWMRDPYDPTISLPFMRNPSEDPAYDADFTNHPLSRARVLLQHLERTLQVAPEVKSEAKFEG